MQSWPSHISLEKSSTYCKHHLSSENTNPSTVYVPRESDCFCCCLSPCYGQQIPRRSFCSLLRFPLCWSYCNYILFFDILKMFQPSLSLSCPPILGTATLFPYVCCSNLTIYGKTSLFLFFPPFLSSHGNGNTKMNDTIFVLDKLTAWWEVETWCSGGLQKLQIKVCQPGRKS